MEFGILGPLEVTSGGQGVDVGGAKQRTLLAVLLLNANEVVSQDRLIDALWEGDPPETAAKALQVYVSQLRKVLGRDRIVTRPPGYAIRVESGELDLDRFERLCADGGRERLVEALDLWRGPPLADFAYERFAQLEIVRLEERRLAALEERIESDLALGRHGDLVAELERLVAANPLRERLRAQLMLALYRNGRQAEALQAYQAARRALVEELGIDPGRELRELHQQILNQDPVLELDTRRAAEPEAREGFVGRHRELGELLEALDDAFAGRGRLFLLQGEPGIGKSRLAEELIARAGARGAHLLVGRCWEAGGAPAYWPWTQSLRAYVRRSSPGAVRRQLGAGAADVAQIVPDLRELFPGLPELEPIESDSARFRLFDAAAAFLVNAAAERPLVLVIDDLHAADEPSLLLLRYVASVLGPSRALIVATFRDLDPTLAEPLESTLAELGRESAVRRIRLSGLSREEVGRLAELTAEAPPPRQLVAALHAETEGNPLFVAEIVRLLAAEGRLGADLAGGIPIPESILEAIGRRLRALSGECRRVLSLASVFGREFGLVALERVADYTGIDRLLAVLDEAMAARVVEELPGAVGRLRFGHALTRDALYEEIPVTHRARLHRRVAEVLESLYAGNVEPHLAELAHHFSMAVPAAAPEQAIAYARRAGDRALDLLAYEEAARLYGLALRAIRDSAPADERVRCELLLSSGEADIRAGHTEAAKQTFLAAAEVARRLGLSHELARAAAGYGGRIVWGRAGREAQLVPILEEGLAALGADDVELRVRLLARLAGALRDEHSPERRDRLSREALELARRAGDPGAIAYALAGRAHAITAPDTVDEFLALGTELCQVAAATGDRERLQAGHQLGILARLLTGDLRGAEADLAEVSRIAEELRQPAQRWDALAAQALMALATGRLSDAEALVPQALELGERTFPEAAVPIYRLQRYALALFRGGTEELEPLIADLAVAYPARPVFRCALAHLHARLGRNDEARRELALLVADDVAAVPFDQEWLFALSLLAEAAAVLRDRASAAVLYRVLEPWGAFNAADIAEGFRGPVARYLGVLATALERWGEAASHFEAAVEANERMGTRPWLAYALEDYGRMLLARGEPGDVERARELIERAVAAYRELGMDACAAVPIP
ncbi:MAG TPA: BTAD domain-containing putative transcriptional regulator [Gaiellaceae bacterium]|nr:BTAD domain-containing putative transcriptional regulator [Gaiellaceae bacterium]